MTHYEIQNEIAVVSSNLDSAWTDLNNTTQSEFDTLEGFFTDVELQSDRITLLENELATLVQLSS